MADSTVTIVGNITRDPELRFTAGGKGIASFGLAVNRRWQQNGEWQEKVSFFNVTAWDTLGENIAAGQESVASVMAAWMASPGHCSNIMGVNYTEVGVACVINNSSTYRTYWTMDLGRP